MAGVDDVQMDEETRRRQGIAPPDNEALWEQRYRMYVFAQLVYDTDRNHGNALYDADWKLWMIDFTRLPDLVGASRYPAFEARLHRGVRPDDIARWSAQMSRMILFAELVQDTDRNQGNIIYTNDWQLHVIDFSRAFRTKGELREPNELRRCDRALFARLRTLTEDEVKQATGPHLTDQEVDALIDRRDAIAGHFDRLIERRGDALVLFE